MTQSSPQVIDYKNDEWLGFPGGELEGKRPRRLCPDCRAALQAAASAGSGTQGGSRSAFSATAPKWSASVASKLRAS